MKKAPKTIPSPDNQSTVWVKVWVNQQSKSMEVIQQQSIKKGDTLIVLVDDGKPSVYKGEVSLSARLLKIQKIWRNGEQIYSAPQKEEETPSADHSAEDDGPF